MNYMLDKIELLDKKEDILKGSEKIVTELLNN